MHEGGQASTTEVTASNSDFKSSCKTINHTACHRNDFPLSFSKPQEFSWEYTQPEAQFYIFYCLWKSDLTQLTYCISSRLIIIT